jgi:SAM-dependent methyltransferase
MNTERVVPHDFIWNKSNISQFWNNIYTLESAGKGFAETAGKGLLKFINSKIRLHGKILDYGVGYGFLIEYLIQYKNVTELYGVEFAEESAVTVNNKFSNTIKFNKCVAISTPILPWNNEQFDFIFITEVIEHILSDELELLFAELNRVLKKGGTIIISVPNNENLESKKLLCPECGAIFHPVQHLHSYNKIKLEEITKKFDFSTIFCDSLFLSFYQKFNIKKFIKAIYFKTHKNKAPNLIGIFRKN